VKSRVLDLRPGGVAVTQNRRQGNRISVACVVVLVLRYSLAPAASARLCGFDSWAPGLTSAAQYCWRPHGKPFRRSRWRSCRLCKLWWVLSKTSSEDWLELAWFRDVSSVQLEEKGVRAQSYRWRRGELPVSSNMAGLCGDLDGGAVALVSSGGFFPRPRGRIGSIRSVSCPILCPVLGKGRLDAELEGGLPLSSNMAGLFGELEEELPALFRY